MLESSDGIWTSCLTGLGAVVVSGAFAAQAVAATSLPSGVSSGPVHAATAAPHAEPPAFPAADFLFGDVAFHRLEMRPAADALLRAQSRVPQDPDLATQALAAGVLAGDTPGAATQDDTGAPVSQARVAELAARLPRQPLSGLVLGNRAALNADWARAGRLYGTVGGAGYDGLRTLLVAIAAWGAGDVDGALARLGAGRGGGSNGVYALFAAEIALAAGRPAQAESLRAAALPGVPAGNIVLVGMAAELTARRGEFAAARRMVRGMVGGRPGMALSEPALDAALRGIAPATPRGLLARAYATAGFAVGAMLAETVAQNGGQDDGAPGLPPAALRDMSRIAQHDELLRLRLALQIAPDYAPARIAAAEVLANAGAAQAALAELARVDPHAPLAAAAQWSAADIETDLGHGARARAIAQALAGAFPGRPEPQQLLGDIALHDKAFAEAASAYRRAIDLLDELRRKPSVTFGDTATPADPRDDWPVLAALGAALDQSGHWPQAREVLERALALAPDRPMLLNYLGYGALQHEAGDPRAVAAARLRLEKALSLTPDDPNIRDSLGYALLLQNQPQQALALFEQAAEKMPEDPVINGHLGDAYLALGRRIEAVDQWEWALLCDPEPDDAAALRRKLHAAGAGEDGAGAVASRR